MQSREIQTIFQNRDRALKEESPMGRSEEPQRLAPAETVGSHWKPAFLQLSKPDPAAAVYPAAPGNCPVAALAAAVLFKIVLMKKWITIWNERRESKNHVIWLLDDKGMESKPKGLSPMFWKQSFAVWSACNRKGGTDVLDNWPNVNSSVSWKVWSSSRNQQGKSIQKGLFPMYF